MANILTGRRKSSPTNTKYMELHGMLTKSILSGLIADIKGISGEQNWIYKFSYRNAAIRNLCYIGHTLEEARNLVKRELEVNNIDI